MQPLHATPNPNNFGPWAGSIGPQRAQRAFPWHSILTGGARLSFGSDWSRGDAESLARHSDTPDT